MAIRAVCGTALRNFWLESERAIAQADIVNGPYFSMAMGMAAGVGLGAVLGAMLDSVPMWIGIGIAVGAAAGYALANPR